MIATGIIVCLLLPGTTLGQWVSDSLQNLQVCDLTGDQATPKIAATSDGGCFISWFDNRSGSYCMYLQRLDSQGDILFPENGLLISDHSQMTWLVDYDMAVDGSDNAVLVFSDTRNTVDELDVTAYMIGSDGTFLWGPDGICLSDTTEASFEPAPTVAVTGNGNSVVTWAKTDPDYSLVFQKISPAGDKLWGDLGISLTGGSADLSSPKVVPAGEDSVIVLWKSSTGTFPAQLTCLYTQKFDVLGDIVWGTTPMLIYNSGAITPWNHPDLMSDGAGGAVYYWHDSPAPAVWNVWTQHVDGAGNMLFPMNGAQASTYSDDRIHMYPSAVYRESEDQVFVFWVEENFMQTQWGLYGQLFSPTGGRLWTDSGLELLPVGYVQIAFVRAVSGGDGIYVGYFLDTPHTALRVLRIGYDGSIIWNPVTLSAASLGSKDDLGICQGFAQSALFAWSDERSDGGIYAQNINEDGTLGLPTGISGESASTIASPQIKVLPNPSLSSVTVNFSVESRGIASLEVYDICGRLVRTLVSGHLEPGEHSVLWDRSVNSATGSGPGVYFVKLRMGSDETVARMVLL